MHRIIIFDLDGTLYRTDLAGVKAVTEVLDRRGMNKKSEDEIKDLIGLTMDEFCRGLANSSCEDEIRQIKKEITERERELISQFGRLYDGIDELLKKLKEDKYILCICSNGSDEYVFRILDNFKIRDYFDIIKTRVEGTTKTQLINSILEETNGTAIVVGDRYTDIDAARESGCISIGVSYGYGRDEHLKADFSANSPLDVLEVINRINKG